MRAWHNSHAGMVLSLAGLVSGLNLLGGGIAGCTALPHGGAGFVSMPGVVSPAQQGGALQSSEAAGAGNGDLETTAGVNTVSGIAAAQDETNDSLALADLTAAEYSSGLRVPSLTGPVTGATWASQVPDTSDWITTGIKLAESVDIKHGSGEYSLELKGRDPGNRLSFVYREAGDSESMSVWKLALEAHENSWDRTNSIDGEFRISDGLKLKIDGSVADIRRPAGGDRAALTVGTAPAWEENRVSDATITLGAFQDRIRLTTRYSHSNYNAPDSYLKTSKDKQIKRFLTADSNDGHAVLYRVDADLLKGKSLTVSTYALYSSVDPLYKVVESETKKSVKKKKKGPFDKADRRTMKFGGSIGFGPVSVSLSQHIYDNNVDDLNTVNTKREQGYKIGVTAGLDQYRSGAFKLLPSWMWFNQSEGGIASLNEGDIDTPKDVSTAWDFGMSWDWGNASTVVSYSRWMYDSNQPGAESADSIGQTLEIGQGIYGETWDLYGWLSLNREDNKDIWSESVNFGYEAGVTLGIHMPDQPDFSGSIDLGRYDYDSIADDVFSRTDTLSLSADLDFSKFLPSSSFGGRASLKLGYKLRMTGKLDGYSGADDTDFEHALMLFYRQPL